MNSREKFDKIQGIPEKTLSDLFKITTVPANPIDLFKAWLKEIQENQSNNDFILMNIATLDDEYGVLNRSVVFTGLIDGNITFVTEKNTRKYANIMEDPKVAVTFVFNIIKDDISHIRQIRFNGEAVELNKDQISNFWKAESVFAKIRSKICECGKPIDWNNLKSTHDKILEAYINGDEKLEQTSTYIAFAIIPKMIDFYEAVPNSIADRVQYQKKGVDQWHVTHVCA